MVASDIKSENDCLFLFSGCLPLLVQLLHSFEQDAETRNRAAQALHNMVHAHPDDKRGRREARVLKLLELIRSYCDSLRNGQDQDTMPSHSGIILASKCV